MCDYSLELYRSRPATQDEQVTLHRFPSGTMGFVAGTDCETAVCLPTGARLALPLLAQLFERLPAAPLQRQEVRPQAAPLAERVMRLCVSVPVRPAAAEGVRAWPSPADRVAPLATAAATTHAPSG